MEVSYDIVNNIRYEVCNKIASCKKSKDISGLCVTPCVFANRIIFKIIHTTIYANLLYFEFTTELANEF